MIHCPVCRARVKGKPECRRCQADLSDLVTLENQADYIMTLAVACLQKGNIPLACRYCGYAGKLRKTPFSEMFGRFLKDLTASSLNSEVDWKCHN